MDLKRLEYRSVIKFLVKENHLVKDIHQRLINDYGDNSPALPTVKKWASEFKRGRKSIEDDPRSGRPSDVTTPQKISEVEAIIMSDRRIKVLEVAVGCGISFGTAHNIIHDELHLSKVSARWVPRNFSLQDRHQRVEACRELLDLMNVNKDFSRSARDRGRNVNSPLGPRIQTRIDAMEARRLSSVKEVTNSAVGWQDQGHDFLGLRRNSAHRLPATQNYDDGSILR